MDKIPLLAIYTLFIVLFIGYAEAITTSICSPKLTATYYVTPSTVEKSMCVENKNAYPAVITLSASDNIKGIITFSQTQFILGVGQKVFVPFNVTVTNPLVPESGTINANYYVYQDGFPYLTGMAYLIIKQGTPACTDSAVQLCNTTTDFCPGIQRCVNYQWGTCIKDDPNCGTGAVGNNCTENWTCGNWSECDPSNTQTRNCTDANTCGTGLALPALVQTCTYIDPNPVQCALQNPAQDGIYRSRSQYLTLNCTRLQTELRYSLNNGYSVFMCKNCTRYNLSVWLQEGSNTLAILANNSFRQKYNLTINFIVDSTYPAILSSSPTASYINKGPFVMKYTERNPKMGILFYREAGNSYQQLERTDCPGGTSQACSFSLDLAPFDGKLLEYFFSLEDIAGNARNYSTYKMRVLTSNPALTINLPFRPIYNTSYVKFNLSVSRNASLKFRDYASSYSSNISLCTLCDRYAQQLYFSPGFHNLTLFAIDQAGNIDMKSAAFFVDPTAPQISSTSPLSGYANGVFNLTYTEAKCAQIKLSVKGSMLQKNMSASCASGTYLKTSMAMNLSEFEGQQINYTFTVTDIAGNTAKSGANRLSVDTIPPAFTYAYTYLKGRYLYWNITLDSTVKYLKYVDYKSAGHYENILCTNCCSYGNTLLKISCDYGTSAARYTYFTTGQHNVSIIAEDKAGNRARIDNILFTMS